MSGSAAPQPRDLCVRAAGEALRTGALGAVDLLASCLARIDAREPGIHAWAELARDRALDEARALDLRAARGEPLGALHGIPIGVKDVIDVAGMTTRAGSAAYRPRVAERDAVAVARLRAAGAVILGKTVTTAFAGRDPGPTRNPWDRSRTPGGSSSGSGAAVGDRMCLAALGTQSGGSVLRPAAFNAVVGFKPSRGATPLDGVVPNVHELDHVGVLARGVDAARAVFEVIRDPLAAPGGAAREERPRVRIWRVRGPDEARCDGPWLDAVERLCAALAREGAHIEEAPMPEAAGSAREAHRTIAAVSQARYFARPGHAPCGPFEPALAEVVARGRRSSAADLVEALRRQRVFTQALDRRLAGFDAAILPTAPGLPADHDDTGDARFLWPFSLCGVPAISLPAGWDDAGLPIGVQLAGRAGADDRLLAFARRCEALLDTDARCPG